MRILLAALLLLTVGCKKENSYEELQKREKAELAPILDKHRAAADAKLKNLRAIAAEAKGAPAVTAREPLAQPVNAPSSGYLEEVGVILENVENLLTAEVPAEQPKVRLDPDFDLDTLERVLASGDMPASGSTVQSIDQNLGKLGTMKTVAVVRTREYAPPKGAHVGGEARFEGGRAIGDVLLYDIDGKKRIGAFPFEVGMSDTANVPTGASDEEVQKALEQSFAGGFRHTIRTELEAYAAGKEGTAGPGTAEAEELTRFGEKLRAEIAQAFLLAGVKKVDVAAGPVVTIHADDAKMLEAGRAEVTAIVTKVLGTEAEVKIMGVEATK